MSRPLECTLVRKVFLPNLEGFPSDGDVSSDMTADIARANKSRRC